jgi:excisionase family DNA binding protein
MQLQKKWYSPKEVSELLGFGLSKTKILIAMGKIKSVKDGKYRRVLPEWVDEYISSIVDGAYE